MYYSLIIVIPIIVLTALYFYQKSKKESLEWMMEELEEANATEEVKPELPPEPEAVLRTSHDHSKQFIRLLDKFMVKDKQGKDITHLFPDNLKSMLFLLIIHSVENPKGASGEIINKHFWPSKNKFDARNNRNVTISNLRKPLSKVGNIKILHQDSHWKIIFGEDVLCDYSETMTYFREIKKNRLKDEFHLNIFLKLLYPGHLLNDVEEEWLNKWKGQFSYQMSDLLEKLLSDPDISSYECRYNIADTLHQHDFINEAGLHVKCSLLDRWGRIEDAKSCYQDFCTMHINVMGIPFERSFQDVLRK